MKRRELEHILRAAAAITQRDTFIVVGSQSILGALGDAPGVLGVSMEADIIVCDAPDLADVIDGALGELSPFHATFGYYAQGVGEETAVLPDGWKDRLVLMRDPKSGARGLCLDPTDLAVAKLAAGREKDIPFVAELIARGFVEPDEVERRIGAVPPVRLERFGLTRETIVARLVTTLMAHRDRPKP